MNILSIILVVIIGILLLLPLTCIQTFFYYKTIGLKQKYKKLHLAFLILLFTVIILVLNINQSFFGVLLTLITVILYPMLFMGSKFKERILFGILNCAIYLFSSLLSIIIVSPVSWVLIEISFPELILMIALGYIIYAILVLVIIHINTDGKRYMPRKYWTGIMICFAVIVVGLFIVANFDAWFTDIKKLHTYVTIFTVGVFAIWLLLYFLFYFVCRYFSKTNEANILAIQNEMIERYILRKQEADERIRMLSHDLKHSLVQWRTLAEEKGDTNALQSISEYEQQLLSSLLINVENESANVIINQKCWEANQARVEFQTDGVFHKHLLMSRLDLCSLLGNLLDNAIEAAAQAETMALRRVKLSIRRKGNLLILMVENGYVVEPIIEEGVFITSKKDKNLHAIGMRSIRYVVDKYDGVVNNLHENNWFKATVMLRGYQTVLSGEI